METTISRLSKLKKLHGQIIEMKNKVDPASGISLMAKQGPWESGINPIGPIEISNVDDEIFPIFDILIEAVGNSIAFYRGILNSELEDAKRIMKETERWK